MESEIKNEKTINSSEIKQEKDSNPTEINNNPKKKKIIIISSVSAAVLVIALIICMGFALINISNTKIISGVKINGVEISGLSMEEATQKIKEDAERKTNEDIIIKANNFEYSLKLSQIEIDYKIEEAIKEAYNIGRNGNIFENNFSILGSMINGKDINLDFTYNEEVLTGIIEEIKNNLPNATKNASYVIEDDKLIITKGKPGNSIDEGKVRDAILENAKLNSSNEIRIDLIYLEPEEINIEKIYQEIHKEPKDAYYTKDPFEIFPHENGIDFDIEEAKKILEEEKEQYEIKLKITVPNVTIDKIGTEAFPDMLSSFSSRYNAGDVPRTNNLKLAMKSLDGVVVMPGEEFSYNRTLGQRTVAKGYREAGGYAGGRVVPMLGGGICQISSTLYNAVLYANLDITERHNHMFVVGYVGTGKDATVSYGTLDFRFKNNRKYPIMIKTNIGNGVAQIDIYGVKEEPEYEVEISTTVLEYIPYSTIYENDASLEEGKEKIVQGGANGCRSVTYKIVKQNGKEISRTLLSNDTYDPMNKIVARGGNKAKQTNVEPVPEPVSTPEPTPTPTPEPTPDLISDPEPTPDPQPEPQPDPEPNVDPPDEGNE